MNFKNNQLKLGIILNYINMGLGNLIPIFYTPVMLALLGTEEYGLYKLSSSITSYLSLISLGIGSAVTRYLIKERTESGQEGEEKVFGLFIVIFQIISVITLVVGTFLVFNLQVWYGSSLTGSELIRMKLLVFLMVCNMALGFSASPYTSSITAHERFIFLQCVNILSTCAAPLLNLLVLFLGYSSIGMAITSLAVSIAIRAIEIIYVKKCMQLHPSYTKLPISLVREILVFSFWVFVSNISAQLCSTTDIAMIGAIPTLATTGVAIYNIGSTFTSIFTSSTTGISSLLAPRANKMVFSGACIDELSKISIRIGRIQTYIVTLILSGFIAFGRPFIYFYAGSGFEDAYLVAVLIMIPGAIPLVQSMCLSIIVAQGKHKFRSIVYLIINLINVIGTWYLLQTWGIIGAAFMTGLSLVIGNGFIMNWYYSRIIGLNIQKFWHDIGTLFIIPSVMAAAVILLGTIIDWYNIATMMIGILIYTVAFCLLNWMYKMNSYEKEIFLAPLRKIYNLLKNNANGSK